MTFDAVAYGGRMHSALQRGRVFIGMASEAERLRSRSDELDVGGIFIDPDFMAAHASHRNRGMDGLAFRLVPVAFDALVRFGIRFQGNGVNPGSCARREQRGERKENRNVGARKNDIRESAQCAAAAICGFLAEPYTMGEQIHAASEGWGCTNAAVWEVHGCGSQSGSN